ncbi:hypothetical protein [Nostoc sp. PA-18-2419]|uniref:hypothetical protein n=1 Tax=Nostoc sp. PA-18-2419 TaxID=2575443 RepID=UPI00167710C5|nr:hypothetical protein [Nostoc sp. PA-18-2419]
MKKTAEIYKQKSQEINYQDVIDKIQLLKKIEYTDAQLIFSKVVIRFFAYEAQFTD